MLKKYPAREEKAETENEKEDLKITAGAEIFIGQRDIKHT